MGRHRKRKSANPVLQEVCRHVGNDSIQVLKFDGGHGFPTEQSSTILRDGNLIRGRVIQIITIKLVKLSARTGIMAFYSSEHYVHYVLSSTFSVHLFYGMSCFLIVLSSSCTTPIFTNKDTTVLGILDATGTQLTLYGACH